MWRCKGIAFSIVIQVHVITSQVDVVDVVDVVDTVAAASAASVAIFEIAINNIILNVVISIEQLERLSLRYCAHFLVW